MLPGYLGGCLLWNSVRYCWSESIIFLLTSLICVFDLYPINIAADVPVIMASAKITVVPSRNLCDLLISSQFIRVMLSVAYATLI